MCIRDSRTLPISDAEAAMKIVRDSADAVSYTHLDVYKRQSIARVMGAIFMKLGRAPATIVIFILFLSNSV